MGGEAFREMRNDGQFVPLRLEWIRWCQPSFEGGAEWGGPAVDPETRDFICQSNNYASMGALAVHGGSCRGGRLICGSAVFVMGNRRAGSPPEFPSLLGVYGRMTAEQIDCGDSRG